MICQQLVLDNSPIAKPEIKEREILASLFYVKAYQTLQIYTAAQKKLK